MAAVHSLRTRAGGESSFNSAVQFRLIYVLGAAATVVVAAAPSTFLETNFLETNLLVIVILREPSEKRRASRVWRRQRFLFLANTSGPVYNPEQVSNFLSEKSPLTFPSLPINRTVRLAAILTDDGCRSMRPRLRKNILGHFVQPRLTHISILAAVGLTCVCVCMSVSVYGCGCASE